MRNASYFNGKVSFGGKAFNVLQLHSFLSTFSKFKGIFETGTLMASCKCIHKITNVIFGIRRNPL